MSNPENNYPSKEVLRTLFLNSITPVKTISDNFQCEIFRRAAYTTDTR